MGKIQEVLADEESMKQLSELASSLFPSNENGNNQSGSQEQEKSFDMAGNDTENSDGGFDFDLSKILMIGQVMGSVSNDKNAELLLALRPLLKEEKRGKVDKAVKMLKLFAVWTVLKDSGMLSDLI